MTVSFEFLTKVSSRSKAVSLSLRRDYVLSTNSEKITFSNTPFACAQLRYSSGYFVFFFVCDIGD